MSKKGKICYARLLSTNKDRLFNLCSLTVFADLARQRTAPIKPHRASLPLVLIQPFKICIMLFVQFHSSHSFEYLITSTY